jgi:tetratricopeptide (TPR) repeat protein
MRPLRTSIERPRFDRAKEILSRALGACCVLAMASCAGEKPAPQGAGGAERIVTHRVEAGETWRSIARDFYGDEDRAERVARDNGTSATGQPVPGSAVRIALADRDMKRVRQRVDAASEYNEGLDLASQGNYAAAAEKFEEASKLDPSFNDASFNLAILYDRLGFREKAAGILKDLVSVAPENLDYRYALGAALFGEGDLAGAEKAFEEVLAREPHNRDALFSMAVVCEKRGKAEEAKSRFRQYLLIEPEGEWAQLARAHLERLLGVGGARP